MRLMLNNQYIEIGSKHFTGTNQISKKAYIAPSQEIAQEKQCTDNGKMICMLSACVCPNLFCMP